MSRAIILKCLIVTGLATPDPETLAEYITTWTPAESENFLRYAAERRTQTVDTLRQGGLWTEMTPAERAFMTVPMTEITQQQYADVSWLMESEMCILWALGFVDAIPPYDTQSDVNDLKSMPRSSISSLVESAELRDPKEISRARDIAELWNWRSRTGQLVEENHPFELPDGQTLADIVKLAAEKAAADGLFPATIEDDFPAFGLPYRDVSAEQWSIATSIGMERHRAFNWLCGYAPGNRWDETPTDT